MIDGFLPTPEPRDHLHPDFTALALRFKYGPCRGLALSREMLPKAPLLVGGLSDVKYMTVIDISKEVNAVSRHCAKITAN